jgi:hypothetical protein
MARLAYPGMERARIEFTAALGHLQGLIGTEVNVVINAYGQFLGAGFSGELLRVETLPPDDSAIQLLLSGGHGLHLDPADIEAVLSREGSERWLEFWAPLGLSVTVEPASPRAPGAGG